MAAKCITIDVRLKNLPELREQVIDMACENELLRANNRKLRHQLNACLERLAEIDCTFDSVQFLKGVR